MVNRRKLLKAGLGVASSLSVISAGSVYATNGEYSGGDNSPPGTVLKTVKTRFTERFNIKHPVICAGMAFICDTPDLAIAVCQAGGVGSLSGSLLSPETLRSRIQAIKASTDRPFHINLLGAFPHQDQVRVCIEEQVPIVSFHWGLPDDSTMAKLKKANISVWAQVGTVADAENARDAGVDAIIVQGGESGGHNYGGMPLMALLPAVKDVLPETMLVFAAGGISNGKTAAAALVAGADAVWVGTRFVATPEANAHKEYKNRLVNATGEETILTSVFGPEMPSFNPMRVIKNTTVSEWHDRIHQIPKDRSSFPKIGETLFGEQEIEVKEFDSIVPVPETVGDFDKMPMLAGQGVGLVQSIETSQKIIDEMMNGAAIVIQSADVI